MEASLYLKVVNQQFEKVQSKVYRFELVDQQGKTWPVKAFGVDSISREAAYYPTPDLLSKFPELEAEEIEWREGDIEILLGMDVVGMHPVESKTRGNQRLMLSQFGKGKLLVGAVPGRNCPHLDVNAVRLSQGSWDLPPGATVSHAAARVVGFSELQDLEPEPLRSCQTCRDRCRGCKSCTFRAANLSIAEIDSVEEMEKGMSYDEKEAVIRVCYPFRPEAERSGNNYHQVKKIQESIERRVAKAGLTELYNSEMTKMIEKGVVKKLVKHEILEYEGGVNYMPHFNVMNPESSSTKLRIVVDFKCVNVGRVDRSTT